MASHKYQADDPASDPSYQKEPKQRELIQCQNMSMITKMTQMLDLIKRSGIDIKSGQLAYPSMDGEQQKAFMGQTIVQHQPFNRNELIYKSMQLFEPAETFETNLAELDPSLQRVGENPPYDSDEQSEEEVKDVKLNNQ